MRWLYFYYGVVLVRGLRFSLTLESIHRQFLLQRLRIAGVYCSKCFGLAATAFRAAKALRSFNNQRISATFLLMVIQQNRVSAPLSFKLSGCHSSEIVSSIVDPFVSVALFKADTMERKDTTTKRATRDPEFKESLEFDIYTNVQLPLATYSVVVTVNHHSFAGKDEVLGHVIFSVDSPQKSAADQWKAASDEPHKHHFKKHNLLDADEI